MNSASFVLVLALLPLFTSLSTNKCKCEQKEVSQLVTNESGLCVCVCTIKTKYLNICSTLIMSECAADPGDKSYEDAMEMSPH